MVVTYRWIQNDERMLKLLINMKCGIIVFEINAKIGQMGRTERQFPYVPLRVVKYGIFVTILYVLWVDTGFCSPRSFLRN